MDTEKNSGRSLTINGSDRYYWQAAMRGGLALRLLTAPIIREKKGAKRSE